MHASPIIAILAGLALLIRATFALPFVHKQWETNSIERRRISYSIVDVDGSSSDQVHDGVRTSIKDDEVVITTTIFHTTTLTASKETTTTTSTLAASLPAVHSTSTSSWPAGFSRPSSIHASLHSPTATPTIDDCQSRINPSTSITSSITNPPAHNNSTHFSTLNPVRPLGSQSSGLQRDPYVTSHALPSWRNTQVYAECDQT